MSLDNFCSRWVRYGAVALSGSLLMLALGCSSGDIGQVSGTVTADGQPLPNATVEYYPEDGGRSSSARTDEDGEYELRYNRETMGAQVGEHRVVISTAGSTVEEGDYGQTTPETLPAKYNVDSQLMATVTSGSNNIDFDLDYEGKVIQPPSATSY